MNVLLLSFQLECLFFFWLITKLARTSNIIWTWREETSLPCCHCVTCNSFLLSFVVMQFRTLKWELESVSNIIKVINLSLIGITKFLSFCLTNMLLAFRKQLPHISDLNQALTILTIVSKLSSVPNVFKSSIYFWIF